MLGVCYYPEHWPKAFWPEDAKKMRELGLTYVRIGEFAWSRLEPRAGEYQFEWLDEAINVLASEGLKVIIGTPTATPPKWLIDMYPETLPVDPDTGRIRGFGSRRHYDFSSDIYLRESLRITEELAKRYGNSAAVVGWQTDNELCCHDTTLSSSAVASIAFQAWCEEKYGTVDALNSAWGTVFWSMEYNSFSEIELPVGAVTETSPAHRLAYRRFSSDKVIAYHNAMVEVIRSHCPNQFVTHNFIPTCDTNVDNFALAAPLDFTCYDNYPLGRTDLYFADWASDEMQKYMRTGHPDYATFFHDQTRGLSNGEYWVMEQQPGPVNWANHNPQPAPGMIRLWTLEAFAHGASCVCYFRWRQAPFAQEQMHSGLLRPDNSQAGAWPEIEQVKSEMALLEPHLNAVSNARVAILINIEGQWLSDIEKQGAGYDFWQVQFSYYSALRRLGVDVDFISHDADFDRYALVVVPNMPIIDKPLVGKIKQSKASFIFGPRSGAKTDEFSYPENLPPGALQDVLPMKILSIETARPDCMESFQWQSQSYGSHSWREQVEIRDGSAVASFADGSPAIIEKGNVSYIATLTDDAFLKDFLRAQCKKLGVAVIDMDDDIRVSYRGGLGFAFNYSGESKLAPVPDGAKVVLGDKMMLPQGVVAWEV